ncbi:MAG: sigma-54-dependent Fis family transcriptional regulator [Prevotella sp.]|nr:sigma-54-dependent Fis family transcriptional regulator [Prevotella sp.]
MILIIDDDIGIRTSLSMMLRRAHYEVQAVASPKEAMAVVREQEPQLIMLDMNFSLSTSGDEGLTLLKQIKLFRPTVPVILMTAWGSINLAVKGMRAGAFDFITKPWNNVALMERVALALEAQELQCGVRSEECGVNSKERSQLNTKHSTLNTTIVGSSPALMQVLDTVQRVAPTNAPVLILGESGTGKELIAEAIHRQSRRASESFVKVNLGGVSQSLFESEMFGYRKGAFTGAVADRAGRFELADKGTIFLDEIGDLDLASQVKLLRVLQDQTFEPLGDSHTRQVNVRVVCATNADLPRLIEEGRFREDLYYRINLITVHLPPLRERKDDIPALAAYFTNKQCEANALPPVTLSDDAVKRLKSFSYPGNIRQLKNIVERAVLMSGKSVITAEDIELPAEHSTLLTPNSTLNTQHSTLNTISTLEEQERTAIENAMREYDGNLSKVAEALGLSRGALYRRLEKYNLRS